MPDNEDHDAPVMPPVEGWKSPAHQGRPEPSAVEKAKAAERAARASRMRKGFARYALTPDGAEFMQWLQKETLHKSAFDPANRLMSPGIVVTDGGHLAGIRDGQNMVVRYLMDIVTKETGG